jgi:hypothetical protein
MSDNKSTGNLFVNDYKEKDKQPDYTGYLDITRTQVEELVASGKKGEDVKLKLGLWIYPSKRDPENEQRFFLVAESGQGKKKKSSGWDDTPF